MLVVFTINRDRLLEGGANGSAGSTGPRLGVLAAFRAIDPPVLIAGGQGQTWRSGSVVLKPVCLVEEAEWVAGLLDTIPQEGFRVARPRRSLSGEWVVKEWAAYELVPGEQTWDNWESALPAVRALHECRGPR